MSQCPPDSQTIQSAWDALPTYEKSVQWARYYADTVKVREHGGPNCGPEVEQYLSYVDLDKGNPWCAAFISWLTNKAGWTHFKSGGVLAWKEWAHMRGVLTMTPSRGALAFWDRGAKGHHIEIVLSVNGSLVSTIGGNTSSGNVGSQNNGDGVYRRTRNISDFTGFIEYWKA